MKTYAILITKAPEHSAYAVGCFVDLSGNGVALNYKDHPDLAPERCKTWKTLSGATRFMQSLNWDGFRFTVEQV